MKGPRRVLVCLLAFATMQVWAQAQSSSPLSKLHVPAKGTINVAFVLTEGSTVIDFAGPWEVFQDVMIPSRGASMEEQMPFNLYTVSDNTNPIRTSGGMQIIPQYTFDNAPQPKVVVVPAQAGRSPKMLDWLRRMSKDSDILMSVCTGAFKLGMAGVLKGKPATTHHDFFDAFQQQFPDVALQKGKRYVQSDSVVYTAGGLSSGIDLALHVVDLYFGREVAANTARYMEYEGTGWIDNKGIEATTSQASTARQNTSH
jgi:transcriptional regulator GlxA family with amidase domain